MELRNQSLPARQRRVSAGNLAAEDLLPFLNLFHDLKRNHMLYILRE